MFTIETLKISVISFEQITIFPEKSDDFFIGRLYLMFPVWPAQATLPSSGNSSGWCRAPRSWRTCRRAEWRQRSGYGSTPGRPPLLHTLHQRAALRRAGEWGEEKKVNASHTHTPAKTQNLHTCQRLAVSEGLTHPWSDSKIIPLDH